MNKSIQENDNVFYLECFKSITKNYINYFLDLEVNFPVLFFQNINTIHVLSL